MTLGTNKNFEKMIETLAIQSFSTYLLIRWSLAVFINDIQILEKWRNKLDTNFINKIKIDENSTKSLQVKIKDMVHQKQVLSNYCSLLNKYYEKLFKIPEKLSEEKDKGSIEELKVRRQKKLEEYLARLQQKFMNKYKNNYIAGMVLPIYGQSFTIVNTVTQFCVPYQTREKIPFKIILQTLSLKDIQRIKQHDTSMYQQNKYKRKSLILPHSYFGEQWQQTLRRISQNSNYSNYSSYQIRAFMIKSGDDMRQQYMSVKLIQLLQKIFQKEHLKLWVKSYSVIPFTADSGLIEFVPNTRTVSHLKSVSGEKSLRKIYKQIFGDNWQVSVTNFTRSLAGYSLLQYLFNIKDRHNNNILIDSQGHLIHIDFSFILSNTPGNINFEKAQFKFTYDYLQMLQGMQSDIFEHFKLLLYLGLKYVRKYQKQFNSLLEIMSRSNMNCFKYFSFQQFDKKFHQHATDEQLQIITNNLIKQSYSSYTTNNYDRYQWLTNDIQS